jgi:hypothetical protein
MIDMASRTAQGSASVVGLNHQNIASFAALYQLTKAISFVRLDDR